MCKPTAIADTQNAMNAPKRLCERQEKKQGGDEFDNPCDESSCGFEHLKPGVFRQRGEHRVELGRV